MAFIPQNSGPRKTSGFTNLSNILNANKQNQLGSNIASHLTNDVNQQQAGVQNLVSNFNNAATQNNLASSANINARNQALQNISAGNTAVSPETIQQFQQFRGGKYTGPMGLNPEQTLQLGQRAKELQGYGQQLRGPDKSQILGAYAAPNQQYSIGQKNLDSLLLDASPQKNDLLRAGRSTRDLGGNLIKAQDTAGVIGGQRAAQAQAFGKETTGLVQGQQQGIQTGIDTQVQNYAQQQQNLYNQYQNALAKRKIYDVPELRSLLNQTTYGIDPNQARFLSQEATPTKYTVGTAQQKAQLDALSQLGGTQNNYLSHLGETPYDPTKAVSFDRDSYLKAVESEGKPRFQAAMSGQIDPALGVTDPLIPGGSMQDQINYINQPVAGSDGQTLEQRARDIGDQLTLDRIAQIKRAYAQLQSQYGANDTFNQ